MVGLALAVVAIALPDSLNPSLIVAAVYLSIGSHPVRRPLMFTITAFVVGSLLVSVLSVKRGMAMVIAAAGCATAELLYAVGGEMFGEHTLSNPHLWRIVGVIAVIGGLLSPLMLRVCRWAEGPEERSSAIVGVIDG